MRFQNVFRRFATDQNNIIMKLLEIKKERGENLLHARCIRKLNKNAALMREIFNKLKND